MAAISGFDSRHRATQSVPRRSGSGSGRPPALRFLSNTAPMSAPAQKPRPAPVTTMAPIPPSSLAASMVEVSSPIIFGVQAFIFSGRLSVIFRTASRWSTMICS